MCKAPDGIFSPFPWTLLGMEQTEGLRHTFHEVEMHPEKGPLNPRHPVFPEKLLVPPTKLALYH